MTDSSSFSSLKALVDSHLSKLSVNEAGNTGNGFLYSFKIPQLNGSKNATLSDTHLSLSPGQPPVATNLSDSCIKSVLAKQVSNMLKAQELKKKEEEQQKKLEKEMQELKLHENKDYYVIDLMQALIKPGGSVPPVTEEVLSNSSSLESLFNYVDCDMESKNNNSLVQLLPCTTDMKYVLKKKIKKGKCSYFGKVLTSRLRPVAAPYLREKVDESHIVRFNFQTKSPCDLIKEKLRRPTVSIQYNHRHEIISCGHSMKNPVKLSESDYMIDTDHLKQQC